MSANTTSTTSTTSTNENLYEVLEVEQRASSSEIKKKYRLLATKWHPDKVSEDKKAEAAIIFKKIVLAYKVLIDPDARRRYDMTGRYDGDNNNATESETKGNSGGGSGGSGSGGGSGDDGEVINTQIEQTMGKMA